MDNKDINSKYQELCRAKPKDTREMIQKLDKDLAAKNCLFGSKPIPCFIKPFFLSDDEVDELHKVIRAISSMLEKVVDAYLSYPELAPIFGLSKDEKSYVEMDPGYKQNIVVMRPDGFLNRGHMQFIEFNCDSPAGSGYSDVQEWILRSMPVLKELGKNYDWGRVSRLYMLFKSLLKAYQQTGTKKNPNIAIVDWKGLRTQAEFEITRDYFESKGCKTVIADPRDLRLKSGKLCAGSFQIDLVYRRVIFKELWQKRREVKDFLKAYRLGKVCVVNSFRSKLAANKAILSVLTNPAYNSLFTDQEMEIRDRHMPWTRRVIDAKKNYGGKSSSLNRIIRGNQHRLVLKPAEGYGGRDVVIGREVSRKAWLEAADRSFDGKETWVVQEYIHIPMMSVPILQDNHMKFVNKKANINPFVFGGQYAGSMVRLSDESVINVSAGGGLIPAVSYRVKGKPGKSRVFQNNRRRRFRRRRPDAKGKAPAKKETSPQSNKSENAPTPS